MTTDRDPKYMPRCGDLWHLQDGRYCLIDYVSNIVGVTLSTGLRFGFEQRQHFQEFIDEHNGDLISRWEDGKFKHCDSDGWSTRKISRKISADYIVSCVCGD